MIQLMAAYVTVYVISATITYLLSPINNRLWLSYLALAVIVVQAVLVSASVFFLICNTDMADSYPILALADVIVAGFSAGKVAHDVLNGRVEARAKFWPEPTG